MAAILGLISGKTFADNGFHKRNNRRQIFHDYPTGAFPLTGLLSTMDSEDTDSTEFGWFEKRYAEPETSLAAPGSVAPFSATGGDSALGSPANLTAGTVYRIKVASNALFQVRQVIWIKNVPTSTGFVDLQGVITSFPAAGRIEFQLLESATAVLNTTSATPTGPVGASVVVVGTASAEGDTSGNGVLYTPVNPSNYTQIFRDAFSFSSTALKSPTEFDKTGIYYESAVDTAIKHLTQMEKAFLFSQKRNESVVVGSDTVPRRTTGGLLWFLKEWERADSPYRGGSGAPAITADSNGLKRIVSGNAISWATFNEFIERAFRTTNDKAFEKLLLCGNGFLAAVNSYLETERTTYKLYKAEETYGMNVMSLDTPFGTLHLKTHPLFNRSDELRNDGFIIDVQNLRYRALNDRDTTLLANRQNNDEDRRKDEWLTEAGLEVRFPESHMYIKNLALSDN